MTETNRPASGSFRGILLRGADEIDRQWHRVERLLVWNNIYRASSYLRSALWTIPFVAIVLVLAVAPLLRVLDGWLGWRLYGLGIAGAQTLYQTIITLTLSFLVFTFGSLLVAIQVASGQLTPRIIATTLLRDRVIKYSVGLFVFSLVYSLMALNRLERTVYEMVALVAAILGLACMAMFLFLIDYAARLLRPVSILAHVGDEGVKVIKSVYPATLGDGDDYADSFVPPVGMHRTLTHSGPSAIVLAVDIDTIVSEARRTGGIVELVPQIGDFVAADEPLFALYGGAMSIKDDVLQATVAFGSERTLEQDPVFAVRIVVDIGLKALSPAINDPTTAVLALDQVHRLLRVVGKRRLRGDTITDRDGDARLVYRTPDWEDFVNVACVEIRACGANNVQIARRLRAMLDNLLASLPPKRHAALESERRRLDQAIASSYPIAEDRMLASVGDSQGLGGSAGTRM